MRDSLPLFDPEIFSGKQIAHGTPEHFRFVESIKGALPWILRGVLGQKKSPKVYRELYDFIQMMYSAYPRVYHNMNHLAQIFAELALRHGELKSRNVGNLFLDTELVLSIFFHDIVYVPGSKYNEEESVQLFVNCELEDRIYVSTIDTITTNILATKDHKRRKFSDSSLLDHQRFIQDVFLDLDLHFLGVPWDCFVSNRRDVCAEYPGVPEEVLNAGVKSFFSTFLERDTIYHTEQFKALYEKQARENIERLLSGL